MLTLAVAGIVGMVVVTGLYTVYRMRDAQDREIERYLKDSEWFRRHQHAHHLAEVVNMEFERQAQKRATCKELN